MNKKRNRKIPIPRSAKTTHRKTTHTPQNLHKPPPPPPRSKIASRKQHQQKRAPTIPYDPSSRILLVGEGDFSFSVSLLTHHLTPTKGASDKGNGIDMEIDEGGICPGIGSDDPDGGGEGGGANLIATSYDAEATLLEKYPQAADNVGLLKERGATVLHTVDVMRFDKLPKVLRKRKGGFDCVGFMFPHVGGLSTDIGRQVKSNQELLLGFFESSKSLLASTGTAIVTLFEGAPYDLWDIKSLARSTGFRTRLSFEFHSSAYPGYKHARTLGNVEGKGGAWKGEERKARTYVFELEDKGYIKEKTGANKIEVKKVKKTTKRERRWGDAGDDDLDHDT